MDDIAGRKALLEASGLNEGRVLDIGMGDCCCMSFFLAKRGFHVVGIDRSPKAVHDARMSAAKKRFLGAFSARMANAEQLPFHRDEFDAVIAYNSFHHMEGIGKVINEMFRVCKNKGLVVISDLSENVKNAGEHISDSKDLLRKVERYLARYAKSIRKIKTKRNMIFICKKTEVI